MSREDVIRRIVERDIQQQGLSEEVVRRELPQLHNDACDLFGTWDTALQYSGISGRRVNKKSSEVSSRKPRAKRSRTCRIGVDTSREAVISAIRQLCRQGFSLSYKKTMSRDRRLYEAALEQFGSWNQSLAASGVNPDNIRMIWNNSMSPRNQLVEELLHRYDSGESLVLGKVSRENLGLYESVRSVFGSWSRGLLAAGLIEPSQLGRSICLDQQQVIETICERKKAGQSLFSGIVQKENRILLYSSRLYFSSWSEAVEIALQTT